MATPFKLKSGNASAFKNLGASPAKQMPENWNKGKTPDFSSTKKGKFKAFKDAANKIKTTRTTQVDQHGKVTVNEKGKTENFRKEAKKHKTVSSKTNKGNKVVDAFKKAPKKMVKKGILKGAGQIAKRFLGPIGVALTAYDVGKYAYKNRKEISKQAKKVKKRRMNNPGDHGRPKY